MREASAPWRKATPSNEMPGASEGGRSRNTYVTRENCAKTADSCRAFARLSSSAQSASSRMNRRARGRKAPRLRIAHFARRRGVARKNVNRETANLTSKLDVRDIIRKGLVSSGHASCPSADGGSSG
eukprot:1978202-Pyramimonas_sp.AAC.1